MSTPVNYEVGDVIEYSTFCTKSGQPGRRVQVTEKHADVKNGRPGFEGFNEFGTYWGYDYQIMRVVYRASQVKRADSAVEFLGLGFNF